MMLLFLAFMLSYGNAENVDLTAEPTPAPVAVSGGKGEGNCGDSDMYWNDHWSTCVECETSKDCKKPGEVCYMGECSNVCPNGMKLEFQQINPITYKMLREKTYELFNADDANDADPDVIWSEEDKTELKNRQAELKDSETKCHLMNTESECKNPCTWNQDDAECLNVLYDLPTCVCETEHHFIVAEENGTLGAVLGHPFSQVCACKALNGFCEVQVVVDFGLFKAGSESLVTRGNAANCWGITDNDATIYIGMTAIALILGIFAYRSSSNMVYDYHRLNMFNIIGTWVFTMCYLITNPRQAGYTKFLGVGIFAHNCAEWNIMLRLWFGTSLGSRQMMAFYNVFYLAIMFMVVHTFPLQVQILMLGTLGATLDFTFVFMIYPMMTNLKRIKTPTLGDPRLTVFVFVIAYLFHLIALVAVFGTMSEGNISIFLWVMFLLASTIQFVLLEVFAFMQSSRAVWCGPYMASSYEERRTETAADEERIMLMPNKACAVTASGQAVVSMLETHQMILDLKRGDGSSTTKPRLDNQFVTPDREKAMEIRDPSLFPDGLVGMDVPFWLYLTLGFIAALIGNLQLFLFTPKSITDLSGACPDYFPIYGNNKIPGWAQRQSTNLSFLDGYKKFTPDYTTTLAILAILTAIVIMVIFGLGFCCPQATSKIMDLVEGFFNMMEKCLDPCCSQFKPCCTTNAPHNKSDEIEMEATKVAGDVQVDEI